MTVESSPSHGNAPAGQSAFRRSLRPLPQPLGTVSRWLVGALAVLAGLNLVTVPVLLHELSALRRAERTGSTEDVTARADAALPSTAVLLLFVAVCVLALFWLVRARRNVELFGARHQHYRPGWAIGGWFVPVLDLWIPPRVVHDVLRDSVTDTCSRTRDTTVVVAWWLAFVASNGLDLWSVRRPDTHGGITLNVWGRITEALAAVLLLVIVRRVAAGQHRRAAALDPSITPWVP